MVNHEISFRASALSEKAQRDILNMIKWVQAAEVIPGNRAVVHHVIAFLIPEGHGFDDDNEHIAAAELEQLLPTRYARGQHSLHHGTEGC